MSRARVVPWRWGNFARSAAEAVDLEVTELPPVHRFGDEMSWRSSLAVDELALDSVAFASAAITAVGGATPAPGPLVMEPRRVEASFGSDKLLLIGGERPRIWAPLSGFWATADGWVRTHANYPHHEERLLRVLGLGRRAGRADVERVVATRASAELEDAAVSAGAVVAAVRDPESWRTHAQAQAVAATPLIESTWHGHARSRSRVGDPRRPLSGLRVLDLTRVIAGPVATRDLALGGADVLRVDAPQLLEPAWQHLDTGQGKRSTLLDLNRRADRARFDELLASADVLVTGYRPGALERLGLSGEELATTHPGLVIGRISAWGHVGPWSSRRGFDSIVQAATGIAWAEGDVMDGVLRKPGALPVQALDHGAGHLLAGALALAVRRQRDDGGTREVGVALARLGQELLDRGAAGEEPREQAGELPTMTMTVDDGNGARQPVTVAPPPLALGGSVGEWRSGPHGDDAPTWGRRMSVEGEHDR